jgi:hypothetical protein
MNDTSLQFLTSLRRRFRGLSNSALANAAAARLWNAIVCRSHGKRLRSDFSIGNEALCDFCRAPLFGYADRTLTPSPEYRHCRQCNALFSSAPMPDYGEDQLYAPSDAFLDENIAHYQRLFSTRPELLKALSRTGAREVIDLAGGTGIFPRMISRSLPDLRNIRIVEVGSYASEPDLHRRLSDRLGTTVPVSFQHENVFSFLNNPANTCPDGALISFVHFIDHLRTPHEFLGALQKFAQGRSVHVLVYCHALDSYKGRDWFVINTGTRGEHQIVYSHAALAGLFSQYGQVEHSGVYFDDQYLLIRLFT